MDYQTLQTVIEDLDRVLSLRDGIAAQCRIFRHQLFQSQSIENKSRISIRKFCKAAKKLLAIDFHFYGDTNPYIASTPESAKTDRFYKSLISVHR